MVRAVLKIYYNRGFNTPTRFLAHMFRKQTNTNTNLLDEVRTNPRFPSHFLCIILLGPMTNHVKYSMHHSFYQCPYVRQLFVVIVHINTSHPPFVWFKSWPNHCSLKVRGIKVENRVQKYYEELFSCSIFFK